MLNIAIINFFGITPDTPGATKHYDMTVHFKQKGANVEFWMSSINYNTDQKVSCAQGHHLFCECIDKEGVKLVYVKSIRHKHNRIRRELGMILFSILSSLKILFSKKKYDVIVLSMPPVTNFILAAIKIRKIKLVADVEDLWPLFLEESGIKYKLILGYYGHQATSIYKSADGIEAVSKGMLDYVESTINCKNKKCWLSPLGVNIEQYEQCNDYNLLKKYEWANDYIFMYIGAHGIANDLCSVLDTIKEFNNICGTIEGKNIAFVFIGDGGNKKDVLQYKEKLNISNAYFEDSISSYLVPYFLMNADVCFTNLRRLECFKLVRPNKLFQYMAASKPIICGIWGEAADIVDESQAGINVDFTVPSETAKKIANFVNSKDIAECGRKGNDYIKLNGDRRIIFDFFYNQLELLCKE